MNKAPVRLVQNDDDTPCDARGSALSCTRTRTDTSERPRFVLTKSGRFWHVMRNGEMVYENSDYAKAVGVFDYLAFWESEPHA